MTTVQQAKAEANGSGLTPEEIQTLVLIERTGAGLSMIAIFIIILTYILFKKLRTSPNLFLLCAAIANAGASVASMIGYDGLILGEYSSLCQAQSFIFQWYYLLGSGWETIGADDIVIGLCRQTLGGLLPWPSMCISSSSTMLGLPTFASTPGSTVWSVLVGPWLQPSPYSASETIHEGSSTVTLW